MPGCGGPQQFVNSVSFSHFPAVVTHVPLCSVSHLLALCTVSTVLPSSYLLPVFVSLLPIHSLPPLLHVLPPLLIPFSAPPPLFLSLPRRSHERLVVCLLEGIPTPPPPPLEPLSFLSLFALSLARCLFPLPFPLSPSFFPSSLFNVEVLSNCWLPLWLGGNGIFRRMPHAVASIHS